MRLRGTYLDALLLVAMLAWLTAAGLGYRLFFELMTSRTGLALLGVLLALVAVKVGKRIFAKVGPSGVEIDVEKNGGGDD